MELCNYLPTPLDPSTRPRLRPGQPFLTGLGVGDILDAFHGIVPGTKYVYQLIQHVFPVVGLVWQKAGFFCSEITTSATA